MPVITLADFRPSRREDGQAWSRVRVEETADPAGSWDEVTAIQLDPLDTEPSCPALRSVTVSLSQPWARLTFLDEGEGVDVAQPIVYVPGPPFRPTTDQVACILQARTYSGAKPDPDDPMKVIAGGELQGHFTDGTRPNAVEVERQISAVCPDVDRLLGHVPGGMLDWARRATALKAAAEVERSYIPEQSEEANATLYQTLRISAERDLESLAGNLRLWLVANRGIL